MLALYVFITMQYLRQVHIHIQINTSRHHSNQPRCEETGFQDQA